MFDKLKVEECPQWDDHTNYIQGVCREHGHHTSLFYTSNQEVDLLLEQILEEKVHLASNATVGAIGILSDNHWCQTQIMFGVKFTSYLVMNFTYKYDKHHFYHYSLHLRLLCLSAQPCTALHSLAQPCIALHSLA